VRKITKEFEGKKEEVTNMWMWLAIYEQPSVLLGMMVMVMVMVM
jgi:hypothetical protein